MSGLTVLVAARDEEEGIGETVRALQETFPEARVVVVDDGSRDGTAPVAAAAGVRVIRLPRRGKGQALSLAERQLPPGPLLLCDADLCGDLAPLLEREADVVVAAFAERQGGGFGVAKRAAQALIRARSGFRAREPLSGQRLLSEAARAACFPLAPGFGVETRMTVDAVRAGLEVVETELPLTHRETGRDRAGFLHRGRQLADLLVACGPLATNHRGLRLPLVGWLIPLAGARGSEKVRLAAAGIALIGLVDDLWSGEERGVRAHLRGGRTTGMLKLVGIPTVALAVTRRPSAALLVALSAHVVNLLDTRPGRALKGFLLGALVVRGPVVPYAAAAVFLCPYDLNEMLMLGDGGSNTLGAVLGFGSVARITGRGRWVAIGALLALSVLGEIRSLGHLIETTPGLAQLDALGRQP
ncbi:MAG: glycosyltransferase family 2 protein [Actinobacteria bacterium]|nr:glycosyltransferase family 2 protein [Actinomycetota bacterium]